MMGIDKPGLCGACFGKRGAKRRLDAPRHIQPGRHGWPGDTVRSRAGTPSASIFTQKSNRADILKRDMIKI
jgi:hypothetical protein